MEDSTTVSLMNTKQAVRYLGISYSSFAQHKSNGTGPAHVCLGPSGGCYRYLKSDLDTWVDSRRVAQKKTKGKLTHIKE